MKKFNKTDGAYSQMGVLLLLLSVLSVCSCKKFLEIDPPKGTATTEGIFENDQIATSAITGIYSRMATSTSGFSGGSSSITVLNGLSSDELRAYSASLDVFYKNEIPTSNAGIATIWADAYAYIYTTNTVLEGLQSPNSLSQGVSTQLQGEAKFVRAFCYFYLLNTFGEVPLNLSSDYRTNQIAGKATTAQIYGQIIADLSDAERLLSATFITTERVRPNKWAAKALLSRVYLYNQKWDLAVQKATEVIDQKPMYSLADDLDKVFLKNSTEAIWQLMPAAGTNTTEGALFVLTATPVSVSLSPTLIPLFETGDNRKTKWTSQLTNSTGVYYYPFKYKVKSSTAVSEYSMVIRLAEIYLIRAEANAQLAKPDLALTDVNLIRKRAGMVAPLMGISQEQCIAEIEKQRRLELFSEWGHRWLDLKRNGRASAVLAPVKGATWANTDVLYPIPDNEVNRNANVSQNPGY